MNAAILVLAFVSLAGCIGLHASPQHSRAEQVAATVALAPLITIMILVLS